MPFKVTEYEDTPNPNAVKCWLDHPISAGPRSFLNATQARGERLPATLFAIEGVTTLFFNGDWMTVNKTAEAKWPAVKKQVERVLAAADDAGCAVPGESV